MSDSAPDPNAHLREDASFEGGESALVESQVQAAPSIGEEIHMPDPSLIPILNAAAVTLMLLGVTSSMVLLVAGAVLFFITTALWIRDTRRELASLPLEHAHH